MVFFTSDNHFGHANVIKYSKRPFASVDEMDQAMIENWNRVVGKNDTVHIIGDFSFHKEDKTNEIIRKLNGQKHLTFGNHDKRMKASSLKMFASVKDLREVKVPDPDHEFGAQPIVLCHYAMRVWNRSCYKAWMLHGHSHGMLADDPNLLSFDVGVDVWNFTPVSYEQVKTKMKTKTFVPIACGDKGEEREDV